MNALKELLLNTNWPLVFLVVYVGCFGWFLIRNQREWKSLAPQLQRRDLPAKQRLALMARHIKRNPFAQINSTLRVFCIPILLSEEKREELNQYVKKIRAIDLNVGIADFLAYALLLLKECDYIQEYETLKFKSRKFFSSIKQQTYMAEIEKMIEAGQILEDFSNKSAYIKAIIAYCRGVEFLKENDLKNAAPQFEIAKQEVPDMQFLLKKKGYEQ